MALRQIRPYKQSKEYIEKYICSPISVKELPQYILEPREFCLFYKNKLPKRLFLAYAQQLQEIYIWYNADFKEKALLAPIIDIHFDSFPSIIYPRFSPIFTEEESFELNKNEKIYKQRQRLDELHETKEHFDIFLNQIQNFSKDWDINPEDILDNYNNIGYHPCFGFRIIDYGLTNEIQSVYQSIPVFS